MIGFESMIKVPYILSSGDIFLNTSISEAFCIAILEAAACGLYVLSTNVGGISEILPPELVTLSYPKAENLIYSLCDIIDNKKYLIKKDCNKFIMEHYNWYVISKNTVKDYEKTLDSYVPITYYDLMQLNKFKICYWVFLIGIAFNFLLDFVIDLF